MLKDFVMQVILGLRRQKGEPVWFDEVCIVAKRAGKDPLKVYDVVLKLEKEGLIITQGLRIYVTKDGVHYKPKPKRPQNLLDFFY